ncbi:hypothetical protein NERG_02498 [Nematocida ausubeli]|uniref:Uncharacterized protein n=1 Tax=Nematocida ausubeli (strain ATCC PRA-371 / ERTm2) TaxID=1913371 RepID=H8ZFX7_NEMA1|nr:hypothetical protein NERG_02498 [Nematocida ausubeli]
MAYFNKKKIIICVLAVFMVCLGMYTMYSSNLQKIIAEKTSKEAMAYIRVQSNVLGADEKAFSEKEGKDAEEYVNLNKTAASARSIIDTEDIDEKTKNSTFALESKEKEEKDNKSKKILDEIDAPENTVSEAKDTSYIKAKESHNNLVLEEIVRNLNQKMVDLAFERSALGMQNLKKTIHRLNAFEFRYNQASDEIVKTSSKYTEYEAAYNLIVKEADILYTEIKTFESEFCNIEIPNDKCVVYNECVEKVKNLTVEINGLDKLICNNFYLFTALEKKRKLEMECILSREAYMEYYSNEIEKEEVLFELLKGLLEKTEKLNAQARALLLVRKKERTHEKDFAKKHRLSGYIEIYKKWHMLIKDNIWVITQMIKLSENIISMKIKQKDLYEAFIKAENKYIQKRTVVETKNDLAAILSKEYKRMCNK